MFRIEFLPVPGQTQPTPSAAPLQHSLRGSQDDATAAALVAMAAAEQRKGSGPSVPSAAETAGEGVLVFLIGVAAIVVYGILGADKPGEGSAVGRESDEVRRPQSTGQLGCGSCAAGGGLLGRVL